MALKYLRRVKKRPTWKVTMMQLPLSQPLAVLVLTWSEPIWWVQIGYQTNLIQILWRMDIRSSDEQRGKAWVSHILDSFLPALRRKTNVVTGLFQEESLSVLLIKAGRDAVCPFICSCILLYGLRWSVPCEQNTQNAIFRNQKVSISFNSACIICIVHYIPLHSLFQKDCDMPP